MLPSSAHVRGHPRQPDHATDGLAPPRRGDPADPRSLPDHGRAFGRQPALRRREPDEPLTRAPFLQVSERPQTEEVLLVVLHHPAEPGLVRIGFGVRVLSHEDVLLLQAEDPLGLEAEGDDPLGAAGLHHGVPQVLAVGGREVDLVARLPHEADPQHERGHARHRHPGRGHVRHRRPRDVRVGERGHHAAGSGPRQVHGPVRARHVQDERVEAPVRVPPGDPSFQRGRVAGRHRDEELIVGQADDRSVVEDHPFVVEHRAVPDPSDGEVGEPVRVEAFEELDRLGTLDPERAEGAHVDQADAGSVRRRPPLRGSCSGGGVASPRPT